MIRTFNMDCMEFMKDIPDNHYDLACVDPPYGNTTDVMNVNNTGKKHSAKRTQTKLYENIAPDQSYFDELKRISKRQIIWGANFFGLKGGYICWNKNGTAFGEAELAYDSGSMAVRVFEYTWNGMIQGDMKNKEVRIHTHQKPVALYKWIFSKYTDKGFKVLDTHGGSFSSAIAAHDYGCYLDIIEIDKDYFEKGILRLQQHQSQTKLF